MKKSFRQRKKGEPITGEVSIPLTNDNYGLKSIMSDKLTIKIIASEKDWHTLYFLALGAPEYLGKLLLLNLAQPVYQKYLERLDYPPARGPHAIGLGEETERSFMHQARIYAAATHTVTKYWLEKPENLWPKHFTFFYNLADKPYLYNIVLAALTFKFDNQRQLLGIFDFDSKEESDFYKAYIIKEYLLAAQSIFKKSNHELSIDELAYMMT